MLLPQGLCSSPNTPSYPPDPCLHVGLVERPSVNTRYKIIIPTHPPYPLYQTLFFSKAFHHPVSDDVFLICLPQYRTLSFIRTSTLFSCGIPRTQNNDMHHRNPTNPWWVNSISHFSVYIVSLLFSYGYLFLSVRQVILKNVFPIQAGLVKEMICLY